MKSPLKKTYVRAGELARAAGVSTDTLRHYERKGVLGAPRRSANGYREYPPEALNTAFEFLTDVASPAFHPLAARAKDVAAGAVLITAVGSVAIGLLVFGPHVWRLVSLRR